MNEPIKTTHNGIEIVYDESRDRWHFTTEDGVERNAENLHLAKKAIEKPRNSRSKFKPIPIYYINNRTVIDAHITSFATSSWGGDMMARITYKDSYRNRLSLVRLEHCILKTEKNAKLMEEWKQLLEMSDDYRAKAGKLLEKAETIKFKEESHAD
jgi:hypothetical protein